MPTSNHHKDIEFSGPASYRIVVQGVLNEEWSDRLGGLAITATSQAGRIPQTTLAGQLRDQAELSGVLETLHSLHLPILKVEQIEDEA